MEIRRIQPIAPRADRSPRLASDREIRLTIEGGTLVAPVVKRIVLQFGAGLLGTLFVLVMLGRWLW